MEELWKDIKGYEGIYQISNLGRVRSLERKVYNYTKPGRILKPRIKENGYLQVCLCRNGKKNLYIHRLVADAFIPNVDNKEQVNHKDFNKANNKSENLEWVSRVENIKHFRKSNKCKETYEKRDKKLASKTIARVKKYKSKIIELYKKNYSIDSIAKTLRVGKDFVSDVLYLFDAI